MKNEFDFIKSRLEASGITKGMTILVHSSFKSLNLKTLGPIDLINALQEVITEEGNLLFPTLTYKTVNKDNPVYSVKDTPSCVGILPEIFRKMPGVVRSLNPIHSVAAWGKNKFDLTETHLNDSITLGINSPFYKMLKSDAKILMLGCGLKPNTFMHLVENLNNLEYRKTVNIVNFKIYDFDNKLTIKELHLPDMSNYYQMYDRVINILDEPDLQVISINDEVSYLIDANKLLIKASEVLKENPMYFVEKIK